MQPIVEELFASLADPQRVIDSITNNNSLSPLDRKTALQLVIARGSANTTPITAATPTQRVEALPSP
jgi:hypothetical protein